MDKKDSFNNKLEIKDKRENWKAHYTLSKYRHAARELLMLPSDDINRKFEEETLLRDMAKYGYLHSEQPKLEDIFTLTVNDILGKSKRPKTTKKGIFKAIPTAQLPTDQNPNTNEGSLQSSFPVFKQNNALQFLSTKEN